MKLIALQPISNTCGTIAIDQPFIAEGAYAEELIDKGLAVTESGYAALPWKGSGYWRVAPEWQGRSVSILAGGPSLTPAQVDIAAKATDRVIAVNNTLALAPWADILYFCDARWYAWHRAEVQAFGGWRATLENLKLQDEIEVRCLRDYGAAGFAPRNDGVTNGRNGGYQALHLAAWLGARRVLLLGFDMRQVDGRMHWHEEHPVATSSTIFPNWLEHFGTLAPALSERGIEVINCTPGSALQAFPRMQLEEAICLPV